MTILAANENSKQVMVHCVAYYSECDAHWEWYLTARKQAYNHAKKTGHKVTGDVGHAFEYHYPKDSP